MKKKGLIVATIVMVLVLAVSLTTATYAWFTTTAQTTIESITIKAAAGADVKIGMSLTNSYKDGATADDFVSGGLTFTADGPGVDTGDWAGDPGMGFELETGLALESIAKATGYGTASSYTWTEDTPASNTEGHWYKEGDSYYPCPKEGEAPAVTYTRGGTGGTAGRFVPGGSNTGTGIIKASGAGNTIDDATVEAADINKDYLHFVLGVAPSKEGIDAISINMVVNPGANKSTLGVEAALYCYYRVNNSSTWQGGEIYGGKTYKTTKTEISAAKSLGQALNEYHHVDTYTDTTALNAGWTIIEVEVGDDNNTAIAPETIYQIEFYVFYDGTDADCINAALGSECQVLFAITTDAVTTA